MSRYYFSSTTSLPVTVIFEGQRAIHPGPYGPTVEYIAPKPVRITERRHAFDEETTEFLLRHPHRNVLFRVTELTGEAAAIVDKATAEGEAPAAKAEPAPKPAPAEAPPSETPEGAPAELQALDGVTTKNAALEALAGLVGSVPSAAARTSDALREWAEQQGFTFPDWKS